MRQKLGQHFLIRESILERIAAAACPDHEPLVVEIGPGRGALTRKLIDRADRVIAIEVDPYLAEHLREKFAGAAHLEIVRANVLDIELAQWGPAAIAGNLPYYVTSPILERVLAIGSGLRRGVFLVQKEVAERLTAAPGSREYGYLSVATRLFADPEALFEVKPAAFYPPPRVDSAVIRLTPSDQAVRLGITDPRAFLAFVSHAFRQKRKTLRNNLAGAYPRDLVDALPEAGRRAEQIPIESFADIYRRLVG